MMPRPPDRTEFQILADRAISRRRFVAGGPPPSSQARCRRERRCPPPATKHTKLHWG